DVQKVVGTLLCHARLHKMLYFYQLKPIYNLSPKGKKTPPDILQKYDCGGSLALRASQNSYE
uniref:Uncharacterized protein n=1 Tax=Oryza brachyantha TaxID=4533 RepID=J3NA04_ORYBR